MSKKSNHKHNYEDCLIVYHYRYPDPDSKGFLEKGKYCTICGKLHDSGKLLSIYFPNDSVTEKYPELPIFESDI